MKKVEKCQLVCDASKAFCKANTLLSQVTLLPVLALVVTPIGAAPMKPAAADGSEGHGEGDEISGTAAVGDMVVGVAAFRCSTHMRTLVYIDCNLLSVASTLASGSCTYSSAA